MKKKKKAKWISARMLRALNIVFLFLVIAYCARIFILSHWVLTCTYRNCHLLTCRSYWLILTHTVTNWHVLTHTDTYWHLLTRTETYWHVLTCTYTYCHLLTRTDVLTGGSRDPKLFWGGGISVRLRYACPRMNPPSILDVFLPMEFKKTFPGVRTKVHGNRWNQVDMLHKHLCCSFYTGPPKIN